MAADRALIQALKSALAAHADAARALPMQAYMKSAMPFHGVATPLRRQLVAQTAAAFTLPGAAALAGTVLQLWRTATHREERCAALTCCAAAPPQLLTPSLLPAPRR
jgi:3-methyladenine DNA glycosylase AlkD